MDILKKVLVCDDVADDAELLGAILSSNNCVVEIVNSGKYLLNYLERNVKQPNLIILDVSMPIMDGFEVARKIRESNKSKDIPILLVSGWGKDSIQTKIENYPDLKINGYIQKPVNFDDITNQVNAILN